MRYRAIVALVTVVVVALGAVSSNAQQMRMGVYSNAWGGCELGLAPSGQLGTAHVVVANSVDFTNVRFSAPVPACNGIFWLTETVTGGIFTGDTQAGIDIALPGCTSVVPGIGVELVTIQYLVLGSGTEVCQWTVEPYPGDAAIEVIDCDGYAATGAGTGSGVINEICFVGENWVIAPYRPSPADGETGVQTDVLLDAVGWANHIYLADHSFDIVIPGHDHYLDDLVFAPVFPGGPFAPPKPFDPGPLAPNTTYHWYMLAVNLGDPHGSSAVSERWSFTTADPIATERTTWGRVKSLYR